MASVGDEVEKVEVVDTVALLEKRVEGEEELGEVVANELEGAILARLGLWGVEEGHNLPPLPAA